MRLAHTLRYAVLSCLSALEGFLLVWRGLPRCVQALWSCRRVASRDWTRLSNVADSELSRRNFWSVLDDMHRIYINLHNRGRRRRVCLYMWCWLLYACLIESMTRVLCSPSRQTASPSSAIARCVRTGSTAEGGRKGQIVHVPVREGAPDCSVLPLPQTP